MTEPIATLAAFKRSISVGDTFHSIYNERIPSRAGESFTVTKAGPSVMTFDWNGKPYRFEWPKASNVVMVSEKGITYRLPRGELVRHEVERG